MTHIMHLLTVASPGTDFGGSSLYVGGTPVQVPDQIDSVVNLSGTYGINVIRLGIDVLIVAAVFLTFVFIFYGGWKWMTSQGDKKKLEEARNTIIFSVVGLIVISLAYLVVSVIGAFFGVKILGSN